MIFFGMAGRKGAGGGRECHPRAAGAAAGSEFFKSPWFSSGRDTSFLTVVCK